MRLRVCALYNRNTSNNTILSFNAQKELFFLSFLSFTTVTPAVFSLRKQRNVVQIEVMHQIVLCSDDSEAVLP